MVWAARLRSWVRAYGFVLFDTNSDGTMDLAYLADDRTVTGGGLQKWVLSGGTWDAVNGAQLFATTTEINNNRLIAFSDTGTTPASFTNLASAGSNDAFRGVDMYGAVPAPGAVALVGLAGLMARRRRN